MTSKQTNLSLQHLLVSEAGFLSFIQSSKTRILTYFTQELQNTEGEIEE